MKLLITGISSQLGRLVAKAALARGHTVIGLDKRPWPAAPRGIEMHGVELQKRAGEDVFRTRRPDAVVHLATVGHSTTSAEVREDRHRLNLGGTRAVFEHCERYGVQACVFVGRHTFYGAAADVPLYHTETDPPLAVSTFPLLADLVAADLFAASALWRTPALHTVILRLCYTIGPSKKGTLAHFLDGRRVPMAMGFDPLYQLMHEDDAATAIVLAAEKATTSGLRGVFNVAGPPPLPLSSVIRIAGRTPVAIPEPLLPMAFGRFGLTSLPPQSIEHLKHPVVVDDAAFRTATGFMHTWDEGEALRSFRYA
jgi:UDP-glucose 4-epimerase